MKFRYSTILALLAAFIVSDAEAQTANCRVTNSAPSYTDGSAAPVSCDTSGNLRTVAPSAGTSDVNIAEIDGNAVTGSELPVDVIGALPSGTNNIGDVDVLSLPSLAAGANSIGTVGLDAGSNNIGDVDLASSIPSGTNNIGDVDIASAIPAGTNTIGNVGTLPVTSGGLAFSSTVSAASTNATSVKGSAGQVYSVAAYNNTDTIAYLTFYNNAGSPTCGTSVVYTVLIPASTSGAGANFSVPHGLAFDTGIAICITTGIGGTGAVGANEIIANVGYK